MLNAAEKLLKEERWDVDQMYCQSAQDLFHILKRYGSRGHYHNAAALYMIAVCGALQSMRRGWLRGLW